MKFFGKIDDAGELYILKLQEVQAKIKQFGAGFVEIDMKHKKQRSIQQNRYLHGVLIPEFRKALNSVGYDQVKDDVQTKKILKSMFLTRIIENPNPDSDVPEITEVLDTSTMTTVEMNAFYDEVIKFAAEHLNGYIIPYPNEKLTLGLDEYVPRTE